MENNTASLDDTTLINLMRARQKMYELILQLRVDASKTEDPNARILLDFSAEMMANTVSAFRQYEETIKKASQK
ncbi:MAG: hypothetical protein RLP44_25600 [Aggregatilineales bacterium]